MAALERVDVPGLQDAAAVGPKLVRQIDLAQQYLETWIISQRRELRILLDKGQLGVMKLV
jgi:hypothetical protein